MPFDPISESCLSAAACQNSVREYEVIVLAVSLRLLELFSFPFRGQMCCWHNATPVIVLVL